MDIAYNVYYYMTTQLKSLSWLTAASTFSLPVSSLVIVVGIFLIFICITICGLYLWHLFLWTLEKAAASYKLTVMWITVPLIFLQTKKYSMMTLNRYSTKWAISTTFILRICLIFFIINDAILSSKSTRLENDTYSCVCESLGRIQKRFDDWHLFDSLSIANGFLHSWTGSPAHAPMSGSESKCMRSIFLHCKQLLKNTFHINSL